MDTLVLAIYGGLLAVLALSVVLGYFRGFIKTILSMVAVVLCVIVAKEYCDAVAAWLSRTYVHPALVSAVSNAISTNLSGGAQAILNAVPGAVTQAASAAGVSVSALVEGISTADVTPVAERIATAAEQTMLGGLLQAAAFVALFLALRLLAGILIFIIDIAFKLPVLKTVNRAVGAVFGALKGVVWVLVGILGLGAVAQLLPETPLAQAFAQSGLQTVSDAIASIF